MKKLIYILPLFLILYPIYLILFHNTNYPSFFRLEMVAVTVFLLIFNIQSGNFYSNKDSLITTFKRVTIFYLLIVPGYSLIRNIFIDKSILYFNLGILEYTDGYLFLFLVYFTVKTKLKTKSSTQLNG